MINADMREYNYSLYGSKNEYGQLQLSEDIKGKIKMNINTTTQTVTDNILYREASYIGLTHAPIDDSYLIHYGAEKLKVLYVNPKGRFKQVFMKNAN